MLLVDSGVKRRAEQALVESRPLKRVHGPPQVSLENWSGPVFSQELFDALFTMPQAQLHQQFEWNESQFSQQDTLSYHYPRQQLDPLIHKSMFTLHDQCRVKLNNLRHSQIRVSGGGGGEWYALVSNSVMRLSGEQNEFGGLSISLINNHLPLHLDATSFYGENKSRRSLDIAQLGEANQWCYIRSQSAMDFTFADNAGVFLLCSTTRCDFLLGECELEFWSSDNHCERPLHYSVDNARFLYAIQATIRGRPLPHNPLHDSLGPSALSIRYAGESSGFSSDMDQYALLIALQVRFEANESIPLFYINNQRLPVQLGEASTLTVFYQGLALTNVYYDRDQCLLRMILIYSEERRRGHANRYYVYK